VLAAAINAATLALINAGIPMYDYVIAATAGYIQKTVLIDTSRVEEGSNPPTLTLAVYGRCPSQVLLLTADSRIGGGDRLELMSEGATKAAIRIFELLDKEVVRPCLQDSLRRREPALMSN